MRPRRIRPVFRPSIKQIEACVHSVSKLVRHRREQPYQDLSELVDSHVFLLRYLCDIVRSISF